MECPKIQRTDSHLQLQNALYYFHLKNASPLQEPTADQSQPPDKAAIAENSQQILTDLDRFAPGQSAESQPGRNLSQVLAHEDKRQRTRLGRYLLMVTASWLGLTVMVALLISTWH